MQQHTPTHRYSGEQRTPRHSHPEVQPPLALANDTGRSTVPTSTFRAPHFPVTNARQSGRASVLVGTSLSSTSYAHPSQHRKSTQETPVPLAGASSGCGNIRSASAAGVYGIARAPGQQVPHSPTLLHGAQNTVQRRRLLSASSATVSGNGTLGNGAVPRQTRPNSGLLPAPYHTPHAGAAAATPLLSPSAATGVASPPSYYVVGGAILNPQLVVSSVVQDGVRAVTSLREPPEALLRPAVGPHLRNTYPTTAVAAVTQEDSDADEKGGVVVWVEELHTTRHSTDLRPASTASGAAEASGTATSVRGGTAAQGPLSASLERLRQLYGTTAEEVIEVAHISQRSGSLEAPRVQYHLAYELLPEVSRGPAHPRTLSAARRRLDWDASIPSAITPAFPPVVAFVGPEGHPVSGVSSCAFILDTNTLVLRREVTSSEQVEAVITREGRLGSCGLYRIARFVCRVPTAEDATAAADRVLEYEVANSAPDLFHVSPVVDATTGDLIMEPITTRQGVAQLAITAVDCGIVDGDTGSLQRSRNSLTCTITLRHSARRLCSGGGVRGGVLASVSATAAAAVMGSNGAGGETSASSDGSPGRSPMTASVQARRNSTAVMASLDRLVMESPGNSSFGLSLANFNPEPPSGERTGSLSSNQARDHPTTTPAAAAGTRDSVAGVVAAFAARNGGQAGKNQCGAEVQSVAARAAAAAAMEQAPSMTLAGAYTAARRKSLSAGSRQSRSGSAAYGLPTPATHYIFPATNVQELRSQPCVESVRAARLQAFLQVREQETAAATGAGVAPPEVSPFSGTRPISAHNGHHNGTRSQQQQQRQTQDSEKWSDDDGETDLFKEEGRRCDSGVFGREPMWHSTPTSTCNNKSNVTASASNRRHSRKSFVEIFELEEEYDRHGAMAMPTVMLGCIPAERRAGSDSSRPSSTQGRHATARRRSMGSPDARRNSIAGSQFGNTSAGTVPRPLRRPPLPTPFFSMGLVQNPVSHLRHTMWQDRLLVLFREDEMELLRSEVRTRYKRVARQELGDGGLAALFPGTMSFTTAGHASSGSALGMGMGNRKWSMQSRRTVSFANPRGQPAVNADIASVFPRSSDNTPVGALSSGSGSSSTQSGSMSGNAAAERSFTTQRRLVLCLALEEERGSVQLHADTVQLCSRLCHSALLRTTTVTRGNREGLQQAAAAVLSPPAADPLNDSSLPKTAVMVSGSDALSGADRQSLALLRDTLELAMTVMMLIGAYGSAVEYAVQRVHALCVLEGDTTVVVNAAQRDLVEAYLFYGDYATAATIAEDVVMLTEQLSRASATTTGILHGAASNAGCSVHEVAEAETMCALACVAAGRRKRLHELIPRLQHRLEPAGMDINAATITTQPLLQAELRLVLSYATMYLAQAAGDEVVGATADVVVPWLRETVWLLRGDGDLQEMEQSFSTVFPSQSRLLGGGEGSTGASFRGLRRRSFVSAKVLPGLPSTDASSTQPMPSGDTASVSIAAAQKRLRWNLLSFAGTLLVHLDEEAEGLEVLESTVKELVLGHHRHMERNHRASLAAMLWLGLVWVKSWVQPAALGDTAAVIKQMASRVVRVMGPMHPFAAISNLYYAYLAHHGVNGRHGLSLVARSLAVLERVISPRSHLLIVTHYIFGSMAQSQRRWRHALEHLNTAYVIAQSNHLCVADQCRMEGAFIGALLRCPPQTAVELDVTALEAQLQHRVDRARKHWRTHGAAAIPALVETLWTMAEGHVLLQHTAPALECVREALRLVDTRDVLHMASDVLRPVDALRLDAAMAMTASSKESGIDDDIRGGSGRQEAVEKLVRQRDALVLSSFAAVEDALRLVSTLFMSAALLEGQGNTEEAGKQYGQCLALLEALQLGDTSLFTAQVMLATAKLQYTLGKCGEALRWARRAHALLHRHYSKSWPLELEAAETVVAVVEQRLMDEEGTYVIESDLVDQDGLPHLL